MTATIYLHFSSTIKDNYLVKPTVIMLSSNLDPTSTVPRYGHEAFQIFMRAQVPDRAEIAAVNIIL